MLNANNGWKTFLYRRNDLTHHYYSPPSEWAKDALAFVRANVEDFFGQSVEDLNFDTERIPWGELCELSGMKQYLPPNLRKGKEAER
jgi:beta-xylosidase